MGAGAEDWQAIGQVADSVKINGLRLAGYCDQRPPADRAARLARSGRAPTRQSVIHESEDPCGLPWYGYDWSKERRDKPTPRTPAPRISPSRTATTMFAATPTAKRHSAYGDHTVYFQDAISYQKKVDLLKQRHAATVVFAAWRTGVEDPAIWKHQCAKRVRRPAPPVI